MKRFFPLLMLLFCIALSACKEEAPFLTVTPSQLSFQQAGGVQKIDIGANCAWKVSISCEGISVTPSAGDGSRPVSVVAKENSSTDPISGSITFSGEGISQTVEISQGAAYILSAGQDLNIPAEGGVFSTDITYSVNYKVIISDADAEWIRFLDTKAVKSGKLEFEIAPNPYASKRTGVVEIADIDGNAESDFLYISQSPGAILSAGQELAIPAAGGVFSTDITYSVNYKVIIDDADAEWIRFLGTKAVQNGKLEFEIAPNPSASKRTGVVEIADTDGYAESVFLHIRQDNVAAFASIDLADIQFLGQEYEFKEIVFNAGSFETTDNQVKTIDTPIYYSISDDSTLNLYTEASVFKPKGSFLFSEFKSLERLDLSKVDFSDFHDFVFIFRNMKNLKYISFGDQKIRASRVESMFAKCESLESVDLSGFDVSLVESLGDLFIGCTSLKSINLTGWDTHNITDMSYMLKGCTSLKSVNLTGWDAQNVTDMSYMFSGCKSLESINLSSFKTKKVTDMSYMCHNCQSLTSLDLSSFDVSKAEKLNNIFYGCTSLKSVNLTGWDTRSATDMSYMFSNCQSLESIDLSNFNTKNVTTMESMFFYCQSLKSLDLSSFDVENVTRMGVMFNSCKGMTSLNLSSFKLNPKCSPYNSLAALGISSGKCVVTCSYKTLEQFANETSIPKELVFDFTDSEPIYESSSYAKDGTVVKLQEASVGNGIDLVFMCDGFSDRMIDNGEYDEYVGKCVEGFFSEEPFKSYRNCFNVYEVYAVSKNESSIFETAFDVRFNGLMIVGNNDKVSRYAGYAFEPGHSLDNVAICVYFSQGQLEGGYTYQYFGKSSDYGVGKGIAYVAPPRNTTQEQLAHYVLHECGGHAFAKLYDEYRSSSESTIPQSDINKYSDQYRLYGFGKNVDFTSDVSTIKWSRFIADTRYESEHLGAYEGGLAAYTKGVWHPTENSVMNNEMFTGVASNKFNAPSREAIYYRINKLAYGEDWQYDYETFVKFDLGL